MAIPQIVFIGERGEGEVRHTLKKGAVILPRQCPGRTGYWVEHLLITNPLPGTEP